VFLVYAITKLIGWRESFYDLGLLSDNHADAVSAQLADADIVDLKEQRSTERRLFSLISMRSSEDTGARCIREDRRRKQDRRRNNFTNSFFPEATLQMQNG
jgi:hypothetical protein